MRSHPTGITIPTKLGERIKHLQWRLGCGLHRVWFGDHRAGWSGINLHLYFLWWDWRVCVLRWRTPYRPHDLAPTRTLRQQLEDTHGDRWAAYDAKMAAQALDEQALEELQNKIVTEALRR
jgi:hypothetical protein